MAYYVYLLRCADNTLYTGIATDPNARLERHRAGKGAKYTRSHGALYMERMWCTGDRSRASKLEYALKRLAKGVKEKLIEDGDLSRISFQEGFIACPKGYESSLRAAKEYLKRNKLLYIDMSEALALGLALVERACDTGVLLYLPASKDYFLAAEKGAVQDFSKAMDKEYESLVVHHLYERDWFCEHFPLQASENCYNVAYLKPLCRTQSAVEIRPLSMDDAEIVNQTYTLFDASEEVAALISKGEMFGAYEKGVLVGFAGFHSQGAMGMLEVFPAYRRKGYARALAEKVIGYCQEKKRIPFAQIFYSNAASVAMQKSMGFSFSEPEVVWLHKV